MKAQPIERNQQFEFTRFDRAVLHLRCLLRDHKYHWHLAGIWREVTLH
jgi:hypothetical protein